MPYDTLIFDLDGTLIDSLPDLCHEINLFLRHQGYRAEPLPVSEVSRMIGNGARVTISKAFLKIGKNLSEEELEKYYQLWLKDYRAASMEKTTLFEGCLDLLSGLKKDGFKMAICTNKPKGPAEKIIDQLGLSPFFDVTVTADTLPYHKPDPRVLMETIKLLNSTPEKAVMIGDSEVDVDTAKAADIPVIAVTFGYARGNPRDMGADALIDRFSDLPKALKELGQVRRPARA